MYVAIDVGGSKTLVALFDEHGKVVQHERFATSEDYPEFLKELEQTIQKMPLDEVAGFGVAIPGLLDRAKGLILSCGNLPWVNQPIKADLEKITSKPVAFENDAKLAALSEAKLIIDDHKRVLYMTISTGIGVGVVANGILDPALIDCEAGSTLSLHDGVMARWEGFASGKAINEIHHQQAHEIEAGSPLWDPICENLAPGMFNLFALIQPDAMVIGGGVGQYLPRYHNVLMHKLKQLETPMVPIPPILQAKHPDDAVIYGCYELIKQSIN